MATLWYGGPIYTLQEEGHLVEAIVTEGDKIIGLGSMEVLLNSFEITIKHNLNGSTMLPGFVDSHIHLIGHGEKLVRLDLSSYRSKQEVLQAVRQYAVNLKHGDWVIGEGWNENQWDEPAPILRKELDEVVPDHPVLLKRVCRHAMVVNSAALKAASIDKYSECPPGGVFGKDLDGELNGIFKENAQDLILNAVPNPSEEYLRRALRTAIADAHQKGLTGVHTEDLAYYNGFKDTYNLFQKVIEEEGNKLRAHLLVNHEVMNDFKSASGSFLKGSKWVEFGAIKIFTDGSLGGRTALLSHPYADDPTTNGVAIFPQNKLNEVVATARKLDMPVAIHAIGDLAFEMALLAIEEHPLRGTGIDRLIHAQILRLDLIERARKLPVVLDIQPSFLTSDFPWVIERVGNEHLKYCYAWKTLSEQLPCAGGSDAPVEEIAPLLGIQAAVTRTKQKISYSPEESLSVYEAVCLYTKGSAIAACHEQDRGMIKEGFLADFTIFTENVFNVDPHALSNIQVDMTVIGGEVVYKRS